MATAPAATRPAQTQIPALPASEQLAPQDVPAAALSAAEQWARAWTYREGQTQRQWLRRMEPLTTEEFLGRLDSEGDHEAAAAEVTGPAVPVDSDEGSAVVDVPTDVLQLRLELIDNGGSAGWQVTAAGTSTETLADTVTSERPRQ